tara:strand:- start:253 stop:483 length:231 start_codon:yes stop_codon:yes gene_type:complete
MTDIFIHNLQEQLDRIEEKIDNRVQKNWLSINDVIVSTGFSRSSINRAIRFSHIQSVKTGGKRMFRQEWIDQWIKG